MRTKQQNIYINSVDGAAHQSAVEIIGRLEKGLNDIKKHLELAGGSLVYFSSAYMIATKALQEEIKPSKKDLDIICNAQAELEKKLKEETTPTQKDMDEKFTI